MSSLSVIHIKITSDASQFPCEKHYPPSMQLKDLKSKIQLVVGMAAEAMQIELRDKTGKFIASLTDDMATLENLGIGDGMNVHVKDSSGLVSNLMDPSMVEKYAISDEQYDQRDESVRAWKKRQGLGMSPDGQQSQHEIEASRQMAEHIKVGSRCSVQLSNQPEKRGVVSFVGETQFKPGYWIGVTYDEPVGKNDGSVNGQRYFQCDDKYGGFVRPKDVHTGDYPPFISDREMEEI
ncbi:unnamed protein product [Anisakis simplex]|uniref:Tubulin-specific chaperone B (inferred by orthology to a C. elegans protein) n=1 Tax=Anisakis simplex TaxID=6269 RepID=A0A158PMW4_ANISI|nr:unnamed protein product [Anisakis simplex]